MMNNDNSQWQLPPSPTPVTPFESPSESRKQSVSSILKGLATVLAFVAVVGLKGHTRYERRQGNNESVMASVSASSGPYGPLGRRSVETLAQVPLVMHTDGCGAIRPEIDPAPHGLAWSVKDQGGFQVLQRNALGETNYRYSFPGTFTVELVAWDGEKYAPMSNRLTINC